MATAEANVAHPKTISARDAWYPTRMRDVFILRQLVLKDFKLKYRRSVLGVAWSVLNPLLMMVVMVAVFSHFMRNNDPSIGNYPLYLILGNTAFQLMSDATNSGTRSIIDAASLLKKVKINRYVFPVEKVLFAVVNYALSLVAIGIVMLFFRHPVSPLMLLLPIPIFLLTLFCIGLSLMLSAAAVFFRDVIHLWTVIITAWTYATPLFYSINILPSWMVYLENFNPMYHYVTFIRDIMLWQTIPSHVTLAGCVISALVSLVIGIFVFRRHQRMFILYI